MHLWEGVGHPCCRGWCPHHPDEIGHLWGLFVFQGGHNTPYQSPGGRRAIGLVIARVFVVPWSRWGSCGLWEPLQGKGSLGDTVSILRDRGSQWVVCGWRCCSFVQLGRTFGRGNHMVTYLHWHWATLEQLQMPLVRHRSWGWRVWRCRGMLESVVWWMHFAGYEMQFLGWVPMSRGLTAWWGPREGEQCQKRRGWISSRSCRIPGRTIWLWRWLVGTILEWLWAWWGPSVFLLFPLSCWGIPLLRLRMCISSIWSTFLVLGSVGEPSECIHCVIPGLRNGLVDCPYRLLASPLWCNCQRDCPWIPGR